MTEQLQKKRSPDVANRDGVADTIREMVKHYQATGTYRPEDVRVVVGDPLGGVLLEVTPNRDAGYRKRS